MYKDAQGDVMCTVHMKDRVIGSDNRSLSNILLDGRLISSSCNE